MSIYDGVPSSEVTREDILSGIEDFDEHYLKTKKKKFNEKVVKKDGCWGWGGCLTMGYPAFSFKNTKIRGHKFSYLLHCGPINNKMVLHKCGNRECTNPEHLYLGNHSDNLKDAYKLGEREISPPHEKESYDG